MAPSSRSWSRTRRGARGTGDRPWTTRGTRRPMLALWRFESGVDVHSDNSVFQVSLSKMGRVMMFHLQYGPHFVRWLGVSCSGKRSNYSDLTRHRPKWWLSKGNPLISGNLGWWNIVIWADEWALPNISHIGSMGLIYLPTLYMNRLFFLLWDQCNGPYTIPIEWLGSWLSFKIAGGITLFVP